MAELLRIIGSSLAIDEAPWRNLSVNPASVPLSVALLVVLLAGLSEAVAQSVALVLNRVRPLRFFASLGLNALIFTLGFVFYVLSIGLSTRLLFGVAQPAPLLIKSVSFAYAPLILSFVTLMPYFGRALSLYLYVYHFVAIVVAVRVIHDLTDAQALASSLLGLVLLVLLQATLGRPLVALARWVRNRTAGVRLEPAAALIPRYEDEEPQDEDPDKARER